MDYPSLRGSTQLRTHWVYRHRVKVELDGREIGEFRYPTTKSPWAEFVVPAHQPSAKVAMLAFPHLKFRTLVFVDGRSLDDGQAEAVWRANAPAPMDDFEVAIASSRLAGPFGIVLLGCAGALPFGVAFMQTGDPAALLVAPIAFAIPAGWGAVVVTLIRWLALRRSWPSQMRIGILAVVLLVVPVAIILLLQAITGRA